MPDVFSEIRIGDMVLPNRFVRSATHMRLADEQGSLSREETDLYRRLAENGLGLIIMGHSYVRRDGKCSSGMIGIDSDEKTPLFVAAADEVHASGPTKLVSQINYGGAQIPEGLRQGELLAPSAREDVPEARAMTEAEISLLVEAYIEAGRRVWEAGLDGVQIHGAHGYFVNQMLSPLTNHRQDRYGGSLEGRALFLMEVVGGIRKRVGPDFPILLKIAGHDRAPGGLTVEDTLHVTEMAVERGLSAVEVSGGMPSRMNMRKPTNESREGFFLQQAAAYKERLSIPIICVHGFRTLRRMQEVLQQGLTDMISLSRPLIRQPDLVRLFETREIVKATCVSCNLCLKHRETSIRCWADEEEANETNDG